MCVLCIATQTQATTFLFYSMAPCAEVALIFFSTYFFISGSIFFLHPLHSVPVSFTQIPWVSPGARLAAPLRPVLLFIPSHEPRAAVGELLCPIQSCSARGDPWQRLIWLLAHRLGSTRCHPPWHGHCGVCRVCAMMARPLGCLQLWRDSLNYIGIFGFLPNLGFPFFSDLIS